MASFQVIEKIDEVCRENNNLLKCVDTYQQQIKGQQQRIYNLELKQNKIQQQLSSQPPQPPQPPQQPQPQKPSFKSLDEYFKWEKNNQ